MRYDLSEDQDVVRDTTRRFLDAECPIPTVREWQQTDTGYDRGWWRRACDLGWTSMLASAGAGGGNVSGAGLTDAAILAEERGRAVAPGPFTAVNVAAAGLSAPSVEGRHDRDVARLVTGEAVMSWAFAEPGSRWDPAALSTTVRVDGDSVVVSGVKSYVEAAAEADAFVVTGRSSDGGLTNVVVPAATPGVRVVASNAIDLNRRFGTVHFDAVRLPASAVAGAVGGAAADVDHMLHTALVLQCADAVGAIDRVFEFTLAYLHDRYAFGRPIGSYQALKHRAADMALWIESAKAVTDTAASAVDGGAREAAQLASAAKAYVATKAIAVLQDCVQMHGGIALTWEHDLHLYMRRATLDRALYGTPEQHRERLCVLLGV